MDGSQSKSLLEYLDDGCFYFPYGKGVADVDVSVVVDHHRNNGRLSTITSV